MRKSEKILPKSPLSPKIHVGKNSEEFVAHTNYMPKNTSVWRHFIADDLNSLYKSQNVSDSFE